MPTIEAVRAELRLVQLAFLISVGMNAAGLGKDIGADDRRVGCYPLSGKVFNHLAEVVHLGLINRDFDAQLVFEHHRHFSERHISRSLAEAVQCGVNRGCTRFDRSHGIGGGESIIVMRMKIKILTFKSAAHIPDGRRHFCRAHYAEGVRQHNMTKIHCRERLNHAVHIIAAVPITVGPVLEIDIDQKTLFQRIVDRLLNVFKVRIESLSELLCAMLLAAFGQQVKHPASRTDQPVNAAMMIGKAQDLDAIQRIVSSGPVMNSGDRLFFAVRNTR